MPRRNPLDACTGFEWDESNTEKNSERRRVSPEEAEQIFFQDPLVVRKDERHGKTEKRYYALGQSASGRLLFAAFTIRGALIRVVSVRDMNRNEEQAYRIYERNT